VILLYSEEKQKKIWNKHKAKGKKKNVVYIALLFEGCMLITFGIYTILLDTIFKMSFITTLEFAVYAFICGVVGIILGIKVWDTRARVFDKIGIIIENDDIELKNLILEGEKIKAIKRYCLVTGRGFIESNKYFNIYSDEYSK
jgi:hypothetical protein